MKSNKVRFNVSLRRKAKVSLIAYMFLLPSLIVTGVFIVQPTMNLFFTSFYSTTLMGGGKGFVGIDNYVELLADPEFIRSCRASIVYMLGTVPIQTVIALLMAVLVNKKIKGIGLFRTIYFFPVVTSFMVVAYLWKFMFNMNFGLLNELMDFFNIQRVNFLGSTDTAMGSVIATSIWKSWAFFMMIYLAGLKEIPMTLYESAGIDGASSLQKFWYITLPMLKKTTLFIIMISTMDSIVKVFVPVFAMTQGGPIGSTDILVHYVWRQAFRMNQVGYASAAAVMMFVFVLVVSIIQFVVGDDREQ